MTHWAPSSPVRSTEHGFHRGTNSMPKTTKARSTHLGGRHQVIASRIGGLRKGADAGRLKGGGSPGDAEDNGTGPDQKRPGPPSAGGHRSRDHLARGTQIQARGDRIRNVEAGMTTSSPTPIDASTTDERAPPARGAQIRSRGGRIE
jgi:hypothetical protein